MDRDGELPVVWRWLLHPLTLVAAMLLLLNDLVLKAAYPGLLTGKLSDAAGLIVAPPLLATVVVVGLRRVPAGRVGVGCVVVTGIGFALAKSTVTGAAVASAVWRVFNGASLVRPDPTDLLTLPALGVAWWVLRRVAARPARATTAARLRAIVVWPLVALTVAATTAVRYEAAVNVVVVDGSLVIWTQTGSSEPQNGTGWPHLVTTDGRHWREQTFDERQAAETAASGQRTTTSCAGEPQQCFRIVPGHMGVEESTDGVTWHTAWSVSDAEREALSRGYDEARPNALNTIAVAALSTPDGVIVVAANGRDGFVLRDATRAWHRIGFPDASGRMDCEGRSPRPWRC